VASFTLSAIPSTASTSFKRAPINGIQIVPNPDFTVSATPSTQTVSAGGSTTYTVNVGAINGFTGSVSFLTLLLILSAYAFLAAIETTRISIWALYVLLSTLAVYTQVFAVFVLAGQWLILAPLRIKKLGFLRLLSIGASMDIFAIPMAAVIVLHSKEQVATWSDFYHSTGLVEMGDMAAHRRCC